MAVILASAYAHLCHSDLLSTHQLKINLGKPPSSALWLSTNPQARLTVFVFPFKIRPSFLIYLNCLISFHYLKCYLFFSVLFLWDNSFSSVQSFSCVWLFATPWTAARQAFLSFTNTQSLLKLMSIESVMPSNHLILCHPLLLPPSIFPSIRVFSSESVLRIRWPNYWSFNFNWSTGNNGLRNKINIYKHLSFSPLFSCLLVLSLPWPTFLPCRQRSPFLLQESAQESFWGRLTSKKTPMSPTYLSSGLIAIPHPCLSLGWT